MPEVDATAEVAPTNALLVQIEEAYRAGKYLWACNLAHDLGPMETWRGARALCLAARLADNLGAPRLGRRLSLRAFRHHQSDPAVWSDYLCTVAEMRGPLLAWQRMRGLPEAISADSNAWSDLFTTRARLAAQMQDFGDARRWLTEAELRTPGRAWVAVERAGVLELEERTVEALAVAREALSRDFRYRPAVQTTARLLQSLGRKADALELLELAGAFIESGAVVAQLAMLQMELGKSAEADESFSRCAALWPLAEPETTNWLLARRTDAACLGGRYDFAALFAQRVGLPFYQELCARLEASKAAPKRVLLELDFGRQHQSGGTPASLAAISRFWQDPAALPEPARAVSADATLERGARGWAEAHGWVTREFRVTWETAVALIDRGVPFTLAIVESIGNQSLVVVGYDAVRQTLLVRDPGGPSVQEFPATEKLIQYAATGPCGMAMVPREKANLLDGLELAEAGLYDQLHEMSLALQRHDRRKAIERLAELRQMAPGHRLTFNARELLARYDGDPAEVLAATEGLLSLYPNDARLQSNRLSQLSDLGRHGARLKLLTESCRKPDARPGFLVELAGMLSANPREAGRVRRLLRRAARSETCNGRTAFLLGSLLWRQGQFEEALELCRRAAGLDGESEAPAKQFFAAARHLGKVDEALPFLAERFRRLGKRSSLPGRTLFWAHEQLNQMPEAFRALESALEKRPADTELLSFAVEAYMRHDNSARVWALIEVAKDRAPASAWLRLRARVAQGEGDLGRALEIWRQILETEPTALDANAAVVELLAQTDGIGAGIRHLRLVCARFPQHLGLNEMWVKWTRQDSAKDAEPVIQRALEIKPGIPWAARELALNRSRQGNDRGAHEAAQEALRLAPDNAESYRVLAEVLARAGRIEESQSASRAAIRLSVDDHEAIEQFLDAAGSVAGKKDALEFVEAELIRQVVPGEGMLAFRHFASGVLEPEQLLAALRRMHAARPDLWHAWAAVLRQLLEMQRLDEALPLAREATKRFPLHAEIWLLQSFVCQARADDAGELDALNRALEADPANSTAAGHLASACERKGDLPRARQVLEACCVRAPVDPRTHLQLASILWQLGEREAAISRVRKTIARAPWHEPSWAAFTEWAVAKDEPGLPMRCARELTENRPGEARGWLALAQLLQLRGDMQEALNAADRAIRLQPRLAEAYDFKAQLRVLMRDRPAALAACSATVWDGQPPLQLRGRAAWVEAELSGLAPAVRSMKELLANHPEYYWGWSMLADWLARLGEEDGAIHAASEMVRLAPFDPRPFKLRAGLRLLRHDRIGAKADLRRTLKLDPKHDDAAATLFDLVLVDGELDSAEALLTHFQQHLPGYLPALCETRLRAERSRMSARSSAGKSELQDEELKQALALFRELCRSKLKDEQPLEAAFKSLQRSRHESQADALIEEMLESPEASPFVGALWVRRRVAKKGFQLRDELIALLKRGALGRQAIIAYAGELAAKSQQEPLRQLIEEHQDLLELDPQGWEAVGRALGIASLNDEFLTWTRDWRTRANFSPELRLLLVRVLRSLGRDEEADEAARGVAGGASRNPAVHHLRVWVAIEAVIAGETERGQLALESADPVLLDHYHRQISRFAQSLLAVQSAASENLASARKTAVERMQQAAVEAKRSKADAAMRGIFRRSIRRLARDCDRSTLRLWGWARL